MIKVTGNKAVGRSSWFHVGNDNPQRSNTIGGFGHYEDDLVKVNGQWFFTKRKIYNEGSARWQYKGGRQPRLVVRSVHGTGRSRRGKKREE